MTALWSMGSPLRALQRSTVGSSGSLVLIALRVGLRGYVMERTCARLERPRKEVKPAELRLIILNSVASVALGVIGGHPLGLSISYISVMPAATILIGSAESLRHKGLIGRLQVAAIGREMGEMMGWGA